MRSTRDRIRHTVSFEIIGLILVTPLGAWVFDMAPQAIGVVAIVSSIVAMGVNYLYNLVFDHALLRFTGGLRKTLPIRILHAVLFEIALLGVLMLFISWYLEIPLIEALLMDLGLAGFYLVYAFVFNWGYDRMFPLPAPLPRGR